MNAIVKEFEAKLETIQAWRHHMHQHPELSFEEVNTSKYIADLVRSWGYEVVEGIGKHGVVASMTVGDGTKSIGLRADTDALPIQEDNNLPYKSEVAGVSHLCGHDGHSTMLLAAGEYLARTRNFNGTVRLIFQPAEEIMGGGPAMIEDGLFERWPVDAVFGMHNMPGLELGKLHFRDGAMMAAVDNWEIELTGKGSHGSMPELSIDPVVAGSSLVMALQTIVSRNVSPHNSAVVTVGAFLSGNAGNVIAQSAILRLSIRTTTPEDRKLVLGKVAVDHEDTSGEFRLHLRDSRGRAWRGAGQRPWRNRESGSDRARGVRRRRGDVPGPELSGQRGFRLHAAEEEGNVLPARQRGHADGASSAVRVRRRDSADGRRVLGRADGTLSSVIRRSRPSP